MPRMSNEVRTVVYDDASRGPTNFFDECYLKFLSTDEVTLLQEDGLVDIKIGKIPYYIILDVIVNTFFDLSSQNFISKKNVEALQKREKAIIKIKPKSYNYPIVKTNRDKPPPYTPSSDRIVDDAKQLENPPAYNESKVPITLNPGVLQLVSSVDNLDDGSSDEGSPKSDLKEKGLIAAVAAGSTTAVAAGAASVPFAAGFTSSGIAAGSIAAGIQSGIGSVAAGSGFAAMQSIAATTLLGTCAPLVVAGVAVAGTAAAGCALVKHLKDKKKKSGVGLYSKVA